MICFIVYTLPHYDYSNVQSTFPFLAVSVHLSAYVVVGLLLNPATRTPGASPFPQCTGKPVYSSQIVKREAAAGVLPYRESAFLQGKGKFV